MAAAARDGDPGPAQELLAAWNTVSTGLVPPAALGLVRPRERAAGPRGVAGTLRASLGRPPWGSFGFRGGPSQAAGRHPCVADAG